MKERGVPKGVRSVQLGLAAPFLALGGWCLLAPGTVERLSLRPEFVAGTFTSNVLIGCFGAQAVLCGLLILFCRFTRQAFLVFGLAASVPFIGFNVYFYFIEPLFTPLILLDLAGNLAILTLCLIGATLLPKGTP
jgi:hypothetical protein